MAVVSCHEIERSASFDEKFVNAYTRVYRVHTNDNADGPYTVATSTVGPDRLPTRWQPYAAGNDVDATAFCRKMAVKFEKKLTAGASWLVTASYSSEIEKGGGGGSPGNNASENPLDRIPEVSFSPVLFQRPMDIDANGAAVVLSNGVPPSPRPEVDDARYRLSYTRNESTYPMGLMLQYTNAVNNDGFLGAASGLVKCDGIFPQRAYERGIVYWRVQYQFTFNPAGYDVVMVNISSKYRTAASQPAIDTNDRKPVFLKSDGTLETDTGILNGSSPPSTTTRRAYVRRNFSALGIII